MKTVKQLYLEGIMSERTHTMIHKTMGSMHNFKAYDDVEWMSMNDLIGTRKFRGAMKDKIMAMANL